MSKPFDITKMDSIKINMFCKLYIDKSNNVEPNYYLELQKNVKKALKKFNYDAIIYDDVDNSGTVAVEIDLGIWQESNPKGSNPWMEAWNLDKVLNSMKENGFKVSYFENTPEYKKGNKKIKSSLKVGFIISIKKSKLI